MPGTQKGRSERLRACLHPAYTDANLQKGRSGNTTTFCQILFRQEHMKIPIGINQVLKLSDGLVYIVSTPVYPVGEQDNNTAMRKLFSIVSFTLIVPCSGFKDWKSRLTRIYTRIFNWLFSKCICLNLITFFFNYVEVNLT